MRIKKLKFLSFVLSFVLFISVLSFPSLKAKASDGVEDFVVRCYNVTLNRGPDPTGLANWKAELTEGKSCGTKVAYGFVFSDEYQKKNKGNDEFVEDLYNLFLGRKSDPAGKADWVGQLDSGASREHVFGGFANSVEFYNLCKDYGITSGYFSADYDYIQVNNVNMFVARLYDICLCRLGDQQGQADWTSLLLSGQISGAQCAHDFIFSPEYIAYDWDDSIFLYDMYACMMGRLPDSEGYNNWMDAMEHSMTRDEVFAGFVNSPEFGNICAGYGIDRGNYTATDLGYDPGKLRLVDEDGIKIYATSFYDTGSYMELRYEIVNNTSQDLTFHVDKVSLNGYMIDGSMYQKISPGKKAISGCWFSYNNLRDIGITDVNQLNDVEIEFYAVDANYHRVWESGKLNYYYY